VYHLAMNMYKLLNVELCLRKFMLESAVICQVFHKTVKQCATLLRVYRTTFPMNFVQCYVLYISITIARIIYNKLAFIPSFEVAFHMGPFSLLLN